MDRVTMKISVCAYHRNVRAVYLNKAAGSRWTAKVHYPLPSTGEISTLVVMCRT